MGHHGVGVVEMGQQFVRSDVTAIIKYTKGKDRFIPASLHLILLIASHSIICHNNFVHQYTSF